MEDYYKEYGGALNVEKMVGEWLKANVRPIKNYSRSISGTAYILKHRFEEDTEIYLTSGEFGALMFFYGYEGELIQTTSDRQISERNYKFKVTPTSLLKKKIRNKFYGGD